MTSVAGVMPNLFFCL